MLKKILMYIIIIGMFVPMITPVITVKASDHNEADIEEPTIIASTAIVMDANSQSILYSKNMDKKMNPASITKIMTALLSIENSPSDEMVLFSEEAITKTDSNGSSIGIRLGEELTMDQALHGMLLMSANEIAMALAEHHSGDADEFAKAMTAKAIAIGATNTSFSNPHGLYDPNHYTTAYDMALIMKEAISSAYFLEIMSHSTYEIPVTNKCDEIRYLSQHHKMLNDKKDMKIYRDDVIAGKPGYTRESGHTLVTVAKNDDRTLIVVIMESDANNLYKDTDKLIEYGYLLPMPEIESKQVNAEGQKSSEQVDQNKALDEDFDNIQAQGINDALVVGGKNDNTIIWSKIIKTILIVMMIIAVLAASGWVLYMKRIAGIKRLEERRKKLKAVKDDDYRYKNR